MIIQLNTDKHISGTENLESFVAEKANHTLKHYADHVTRVEVHLSDQNADKGGADDILCKVEARVEGMQPIITESKSNSKEKALSEALNKMKSSLSKVIGKMRQK